jgi:hypothetical protein
MHTNVSPKDNDGKGVIDDSRLIEACSKGDKETATRLLEAGANVHT